MYITCLNLRVLLLRISDIGSQLKVRPARVAARTVRQVKCMIQALKGETVEWSDEEKVEEVPQSHSVKKEDEH